MNERMDGKAPTLSREPNLVVAVSLTKSRDVHSVILGTPGKTALDHGITIAIMKDKMLVLVLAPAWNSIRRER